MRSHSHAYKALKTTWLSYFINGISPSEVKYMAIKRSPLHHRIRTTERERERKLNSSKFSSGLQFIKILNYRSGSFSIHMTNGKLMIPENRKYPSKQRKLRVSIIFAHFFKVISLLTSIWPSRNHLIGFSIPCLGKRSHWDEKCARYVVR